MADDKPPPKKGGGGASPNPLGNPLKGGAPPPGRLGGGPPAAGAPKGPQGPGQSKVTPGTRITLSGGGAKKQAAGQAYIKALLGKKKPWTAPSSGAGAEAPQEQEEVPEEEEKIEETLLAQEWLKDVENVPLVHRFIEELAPKIAVAHTSLAILDAFSHHDVKAEKVAGVVKGNPYYEAQFQKVMRSLTSRVQLPSLDSSIVLLGMQNSRNLILSMQMMRSVFGTHPEYDKKDGRIKLHPQDVLRYALRTEEVLSQDKESGQSETAYSAGYLFDILAQIATRTTEPKKVAAYIDGLYAHSLRTARLGRELSNHLPEFTYKKYIFAACLVHDIGKAVLAVLEPQYIAFSDEVKKKGTPRAVRVFAERKRFGVSHATLGALVCFHYEVFKPIARAILCHHDPYLLKRDNRSMYQLASIVCLATNIANNFKKVEKAKDPITAVWNAPEVRDFGMPSEVLVATVQKVTKDAAAGTAAARWKSNVPDEEDESGGGAKKE